MRWLAWPTHCMQPCPVWRNVKLSCTYKQANAELGGAWGCIYDSPEQHRPVSQLSLLTIDAADVGGWQAVVPKRLPLLVLWSITKKRGSSSSCG